MLCHRKNWCPFSLYCPCLSEWHTDLGEQLLKGPMQVTLGGWLSYFQIHFLSNWETRMCFPSTELVVVSLSFFGFTWFLCGCSPASPVQIYYSVSNATWKRRKTSLKGNGSAKGSNEQPVLWTHELHSFSKDLVTAHLSTENLISTIYTLSPHPFSHRFKQSRSCWYLYWSQCQRTKHSYEQFSETLWLDKIQWSSYHGLSCNVAHLFQFLISTEGKNIISTS